MKKNRYRNSSYDSFPWYCPDMCGAIPMPFGDVTTLRPMFSPFCDSEELLQVRVAPEFSPI